MTTIPFYKYQGTGNDFVMIDQRTAAWLSADQQSVIERMCDRRFGIGADGLILIETHPTLDFKMVYFNSDGRQSSMCGNGGRCAVAFAKYLEIFETSTEFEAIDGYHAAAIDANGIVSLGMKDVESIHEDGGAFVLDTGSPHYILPVESMDSIDMVQLGQSVRYNDTYAAKGINVNAVVMKEDALEIRTYERGVEDETLSCGTGVTAAAIAWHTYHKLPTGYYNLPVLAKGGNLSLSFQANENGSYTSIQLKGPAERVFIGEFYLDDK